MLRPARLTLPTSWHSGLGVEKCLPTRHFQHEILRLTDQHSAESRSQKIRLKMAQVATFCGGSFVGMSPTPPQQVHMVKKKTNPGLMLTMKTTALKIFM